MVIFLISKAPTLYILCEFLCHSERGSLRTEMDQSINDGIFLLLMLPRRFSLGSRLNHLNCFWTWMIKKHNVHFRFLLLWSQRSALGWIAMKLLAGHSWILFKILEYEWGVDLNAATHIQLRNNCTAEIQTNDLKLDYWARIPKKK